MPILVILVGGSLLVTAFLFGKSQSKPGVIISIGAMVIWIISGFFCAVGEMLGYTMWDFFGLTELIKNLLKLLF